MTNRGSHILKQSRETILATLMVLQKYDTAITDEKIRRVVSVLDWPSDDWLDGDRIVSREDVAARCNISPKAVDAYCREGTFRRVRLGNSSRASGISAKSVSEAISNGLEPLPATT